jgi:hypothetical protein
MPKIRTYSCILLLVLLLLPMATIIAHQFEHYNIEQCKATELHFCNTEHDCKLCDYIFSTPSSYSPSQHQTELNIVIQIIAISILLFLVKPITALKYRLSHRGPPIC